jgi:hypothetical protein
VLGINGSKLPVPRSRLMPFDHKQMYEPQAFGLSGESLCMYHSLPSPGIRKTCPLWYGDVMLGFEGEGFSLQRVVGYPR